METMNANASADKNHIEADLADVGPIFEGEVTIVNDKKLLFKIDCRLMPIL